MPLVSTVPVEDSRAQRQQRLQARFRDRGGIFVPSGKNTLVDILLARTVSGESPPKSLIKGKGRLREPSSSPLKCKATPRARAKVVGGKKRITRKKAVGKRRVDLSSDQETNPPVTKNAKRPPPIAKSNSKPPSIGALTPRRRGGPTKSQTSKVNPNDQVTTCATTKPHGRPTSRSKPMPPASDDKESPPKRSKNTPISVPPSGSKKRRHFGDYESEGDPTPKSKKPKRTGGATVGSATTRIRRKKIKVDENDGAAIKITARSKSDSAEPAKRPSSKMVPASKFDDDALIRKTSSETIKPRSRSKAKAPSSDSDDDESEYTLPPKRVSKQVASGSNYKVPNVKSCAPSESLMVASKPTITVSNCRPSERPRGRNTTPKNSLAVSDKTEDDVPLRAEACHLKEGAEVIGKRTLSTVVEINDDFDELTAINFVPGNISPRMQSKAVPVQSLKNTWRVPPEVSIQPQSRKRHLEVGEAENARTSKKRATATRDVESGGRKTATMKANIAKQRKTLSSSAAHEAQQKSSKCRPRVDDESERDEIDFLS